MTAPPLDPKTQARLTQKAAEAAHRARELFERAQARGDVRDMLKAARMYRDEAAVQYRQGGQPRQAQHAMAESYFASYAAHKVRGEEGVSDAWRDLNTADDFLHQGCDHCKPFWEKWRKLVEEEERLWKQRTAALKTLPTDLPAPVPFPAKPAAPLPKAPAKLSYLGRQMREFDAGERFHLTRLNELDWERVRRDATRLTDPEKRSRAFTWCRKIADRLEAETATKNLRQIVADRVKVWVGPDPQEWERERRRLRALFRDEHQAGGALKRSLAKRIAAVQEVLIDAEVKRLNVNMALVVGMVFTPLFVFLLFPYDFPGGRLGFCTTLTKLPSFLLIALSFVFAVPRFTDQVIPQFARSLWHENAVRLSVLIFVLSFASFLWTIFSQAAAYTTCTTDAYPDAKAALDQVSILLATTAVIGIVMSRLMVRWQTFSTTSAQRVFFYITALLLFVILVQILLTQAIEARTLPGLTTEQLFPGIVAAVGATIAGLAGYHYRRARRGSSARMAVQELLDDLAELPAPSKGTVDEPLRHLEKQSADGEPVSRWLTRVFGEPTNLALTDEVEAAYGAKRPAFLLMKDRALGRVMLEYRRLPGSRSDSFFLQYAPAAKAPTPEAAAEEAEGAEPRASVWDRTDLTADVWESVLASLRQQKARMDPPKKGARKTEAYLALRELIMRNPTALKNFLAVKWRGNPRSLVFFARLLSEKAFVPEEETDGQFLEAELGDVVRGDPEWIPETLRWEFKGWTVVREGKGKSPIYSAEYKP